MRSREMKGILSTLERRMKGGERYHDMNKGGVPMTSMKKGLDLSRTHVKENKLSSRLEGR